MATYTTWNPSDKSAGITLSNGDLTGIDTVASPTRDGARATIGKSSGKWYWEVTIGAMIVPFSYNYAIGIDAGSLDFSVQAGSLAGTYIYRGDSLKANNGSWTGYGNTYTTSDIIGIALDLGNGKVWFSKNGVWQASGDPGAGTDEAFSGLSGTYYPVIQVMKIGDEFTANFGASAFSYTVPSGFNSGLYEANEVVFPSPLSSATSLQSNIQVEIVPGVLSVESSISTSEPFWGSCVELPSAFTGQSSLSVNTEIGVAVTPLIAQSDLQGNLQIEIVPGILEAYGNISAGEIFCGIILILPQAFMTNTSLQGGVKTFTQKTIKLINSFGEQLQKSLINSFGEQQWQVAPVGIGIENYQHIFLLISFGIMRCQAVVSALLQGDPTQSIQSSLGSLKEEIQRISAILGILSGSQIGISAIRQSCSEGDIGAIQNVLLTILDKDIAQNIQKLSQTIDDLGTTFPSVVWNIYFDGIPIKAKIQKIQVTYNEDSVHNSIEIHSWDKELFGQADANELQGEMRFELHLESRVLYFLLESRQGDELEFSLWGRSLSAREDQPYALDLDYSLEEPTSAQSVAEEILTVSVLDWQCEDWVLPISFEFEGSPIEGVLQIAAAIGAVVRCEDDGTICVRQQFPVRPIDMDGASVAVNYDRANLTRLDYDDTKGTHYNAIEVIGCADDVYLPDIHIEESSPEMGEDVHIRVYWAGKKPSGIIETYVTDGGITSLGEQTKEEEESETIVFEDGIASVSKPVTSIVSIEWIGDSGGDISCERYSKDLEIVDEAYRIAKAVYRTTYSRYRISDHDVEMLLALLTFGGESDVSVEVKIGSGDKPAPALNSPLLATQSVAVVAGTAWLDANRYDQKRVTLETPYDNNATDGVLAYINDAEIDCAGNFHIERCDIIMDGPKVTNKLGVVQCQV